MTLKAPLDRHRAASRQRLPQDGQDIMRRATEELRTSEIMDRMLGIDEPCAGLYAARRQRVTGERGRPPNVWS